MKKILLLISVCIVMYPCISKSSSGDESNQHPWKSIRQYADRYIKPVIKEKRIAFDALLTASERSDLADMRIEVQRLHQKSYPFMHENREALPEQAAPMMTDEAGKEKHHQWKEVMSRIHEIADRHTDELDQVLIDLRPQFQQWIEDISKLIPADEENATSFLRGMGEEHRGPFRMLGHAAFLLLDPSKTMTAGNENKIAAADILPASVAESLTMFPNPAMSRLTLNLENIPADNTFIITDTEGKIILEKENLTAIESIDCSGFPAGMYFVQVRSGDEIINKKLIVSH